MINPPESHPSPTKLYQQMKLQQNSKLKLGQSSVPVVMEVEEVVVEEKVNAMVGDNGIAL